MTEGEWLVCLNPTKLGGFLIDRGQEYGRKYRLFACACVRRVWRLLTDERYRTVTEMAEQVADGLIPEEQIGNAWEKWCDDPAFADGSDGMVAALSATGTGARWSPEDAQKHALIALVDSDVTSPESRERAELEELEAQGRLLHCIFGNPFRPTSLASALRTPAVISLAQCAYNQRALPSGELDRVLLSILADALEDAGCNTPELLAHLRNPGPHVRGCWPVDLIMARE